METPESEAGLNFLKEKIVASMKARGEVADINSKEIHAMAIKFRADMDERAEAAKERLRQKGFCNPGEPK